MAYFALDENQAAVGGLGSAVAGDYAESPAKPQVLRLTYFVAPEVLPPVLPELEPGVVVELLPEPEPMPLDPGVVGLVVVPVELEPLLPEAPLPALPLDELPLRASRSHLSFSAPVSATHLLASLPDAPDAAPAEPELPDVELSLLPEDEPLADGVLELDDGLLELAPEDGDAEGVLAPPDEPAPVLPEDAPLLPLLEPEDCEKATPDSARSAAAVAAVRVFNIMRRSPSKGE